MESAQTTTIAVTTVKDKEAGRLSSTLATMIPRHARSVRKGGMLQARWEE
jgi:hypothetical protein